MEVNGEPWFTADVVGKGLGYAQQQARKSVGYLYQRFSDEFRGNDTCVINLMTQGQRRVTRVFSLSGIVLLGFFANTEPAKKFRQFRATILTFAVAWGNVAREASKPLKNGGTGRHCRNDFGRLFCASRFAMAGVDRLEPARVLP